MPLLIEEMMNYLKTGRNPLTPIETNEIPRAVKAQNYAQMTGMSAGEVYYNLDSVQTEFDDAMNSPDLASKMALFKPDAGDGVDPFTGATAKDYAEVALPFVRSARALGYNTYSGAMIGMAGFLHDLDLVLRYVERHTGAQMPDLLRRASEHANLRSDYFKGKAKEEGIGPVDEFFTDLAGSVIPGIINFMADIPGLYPLHALREAERAAQRGDNEFVGMFKGYMERMLMGQIFHAASVLPRPARMPAIGLLFEEQARSAGEIDPEALAKAFLTGGIFGIVGGKGKIGMRDVVREIHNLEKEFPVSLAGAKGPVDALVGGERGSIPLEGMDRWLSNMAETVRTKGEKHMPANEWVKRVRAWEDKDPHIRDENRWNGLVEWLESREGEKVDQREILDYLEASKGKWAVREQVKGALSVEERVRLEELESRPLKSLSPQELEERYKLVDRDRFGGEEDQWASRNIPGGIPGTAKVYTLSVPTPDPLELYKPEKATIRADYDADRIDTGEYRARMDELDSRIADSIQGQFASPHFPGRPNVFLHFRTEERLDSAGRKGIMIETIQSDWHQARIPNPNVVQKRIMELREIAKDVSLPVEERERAVIEYNRLEGDIEGGEGRLTRYIPPAPFEKSWHEAGLKHVLDIASKDPTIGWVAWPGGEVQSIRWGKEDTGVTFLNTLYDKRLPKFAEKYAAKLGGRYREVLVEAPPISLGQGFFAPGPPVNLYFVPSRRGEGRWDAYIVGDDGKNMAGFSVRGADKSAVEEAYGEGVYDKMVGEWESGERAIDGGRKVGYLELPSPAKGTPNKWEEYPIHRIDLTPQMKDRINTKGQLFYTGVDPTRIPEMLKGLADNLQKAADLIRETGRNLYLSGKRGKSDWIEGMKAILGDSWKDYKDQVEALWGAIEASNPEQRKIRPALKVDETVYEANIDEPTHGQIWDRIPSDKLETAKDIESGWVDEAGNWFVKRGEKPLDLGPELTASEAAALISSITGEKKDMADFAQRNPVLVKLYNDTKAALTPGRIANLKFIIRKATGQVKVQDIIEVKEGDALNDQIRFAARNAKIAFAEGKKDGVEIGREKGEWAGATGGFWWGQRVGKARTAERFHQAIERARERSRQQKVVRKMIGELKALDTSTMTDYARTEIETLLADIDLTKLSSGKRLSLERTREWLDRNPDSELPSYVMDDLARLDKKSVRDMTFDEFDSLHKAVMSLAAQSKLAHKIWDGIQERRHDQAVSGSIAEMRPPEKVLADIISTKPKLWDKVHSVTEWMGKTLGMRQDSFDLIVESLAGVNSTMHRVLYRMVKRGDPTGLIPGGGKIGEKAYIQEQQKLFREELEGSGFFEKVRKVDKWLDERVKVEVDGKTWELSRGERMALYRHSLNDDNLNAILSSGVGFKHAPPSSGIRPNTVIPITEKEIKAIVDSLSPEELMFAGPSGPATALFARQGKQLDDTFYKLNLYRMELEDNYYPKDVMPLNRGGYDLETEEGLEAFRQFTARVGIEKGMLEARAGSTKPIYLNDIMSDITRSVSRSAAYIHLEGPMRNASKLLYDSEFRKALVDRYGRDSWVEIEKGLKDIATNYRLWTETEKGLMKLKTNAVSSILALNPWVWMNQPASLVFYNVYVESKYLARGLVDVSTPRGAQDILDTIRSYSPELVDRLEGGYDRDVALAFQQSREKGFYGGKETLKEKLLEPTKWADLTGVIPGMRAAYLKAMDEFQTGQLSKWVKDALDIKDVSAVKNWTPQQMEAKAWEFADWVTERTQAQANVEHRSPLSRGTPIEQIFTAMSSQTTAMLGVVRRTTREYRRTGDPEARNAMLKAYMQVFLINATMMMGIDRMRDLLYGRDSKSLMQGFIDNAASTVLFVREVESAVSSHLFEGGRGYDLKYPIMKFAEHFADAAANINTMVTTRNERTRQEAQGKFIDNMLGLISILSGYPYQTPKRILDATLGDNPPPKKRRNTQFEDELLDW